MRTVLIGTDFMYDSNGNLVPIEMNTNVTLNRSSIVEDIVDVFDFTNLEAFINENNFTGVTYIGSITELNDELNSFCTSKSMTYTNYEIGGTALTVPYVEDNDNLLIIRSAYDTTAIIDDTYCANKSNFVELVKSQSFGLEHAYVDSNGTLINTFTTILDNGVHPNFILRPVQPGYDVSVYPKLFKASSMDELNTIISQNVTVEYLLTPFLINTNKLYNGTHIQVFRSYNLLYPPTLSSISIGQNTMIAPNEIPNSPTYDSTTFQIDDTFRTNYMSSMVDFAGFPKLKDTDRVLMQDDTWKAPNELKAGDIVKTISIPNPNDVDTSIEGIDFGIDLDTFNAGATYTYDRIVGVHYLNTLTRLATITFTDGSVWSDGELVYFLTYTNNDVKWKQVFQLVAGDQLIAVNTNSEVTLYTDLKTIQSVEITREFFTGWVISVENDHLFIVNDTLHNNSFSLFEHNTTCSACTRLCSVQCLACPLKTQPACTNNPAAAICTSQC